MIEILQKQNPEAVVMIPQGYDGEFGKLKDTMIQSKKIAEWQLDNLIATHEMGEYGENFEILCLG